MKVLVWVSCGTTSAIAGKLAIQQYGLENCDFYYIGIKTAHEDNIRFLKDLEKWYGKEIITERSAKYEDQFEVIEDTGYVNGAGGARCTIELKKAVRFKIQHQYPDAIQIFGFEYGKKEINRALRFLEQYPECNARFPLIEQQITKPECAEILLMNNIQLPAMYLLGYSNNNCIGCVKGKKGYWNKIRVDFPEIFERMKLAEREAGHACIKQDRKVNRAMTDDEYLKFKEEKNKWFQKDNNLFYNKNGEIVNPITHHWIAKLEGYPVFLDELKPNEGRKLKPIVPDCGSLCEIKFTDIIDKRTAGIYRQPEKIKDLYRSVYGETIIEEEQNVTDIL